MTEGKRRQEGLADFALADLVGTLGFGLMLSLLLIAFLSHGMGCAAADNPRLFAALRASGMVALACTLFAVQFFADRLSTRAAVPRLLVAATLLVAAPAGVLYLTHGVALTAAVPILCWIVLGVGLGLTFPLWAVFSSMLPEKLVPQLTALSFLVGGLWAGFALQIPDALQPALIVLSVVLSAVLYGGYLHEAALPAAITRDESKERVSLSVRTCAAICCYGMVAALALQFLAAAGAHAGSLIAGGAFALAAAASWVAATLLGARNDPFSFSHSQRFAFPLLVAGLLLAVLGLPPNVTRWGMGLVLVGYFFLDVFNWSTLSSLCSRYRSQPIYQFALGRAPLGLGLALGWVIVAVLSDGSAPAVLEWPVVAAGAVLLLACSVAIAPYGSDTLTDKRSLDKLRENPLYSPDVKGGLFRRACLAVAEEGSLTPREREVLLLLAKGRSAAVIQEELSISGGTVRTHTYHIYRKLNVTSQQEIISMVEEKARG
ncbi:helix-turn-helix transcriptional regulator [Adlercreutzia equolifaciens]|uniref:helix-turn-helix domain-containing protein n=1 Tax=Adlercreutzia equolifaciens TaxID=446660 RepID=UPI0023B1A8C1|nr:helix-turn-helix transcriptional regulator [Adlercreutzia equolifaciens]MDE8703278.1 helix-turn-helix transcriptional regulator [Adlercreutzia equolifaciens]